MSVQKSTSLCFLSVVAVLLGSPGSEIRGQDIDLIHAPYRLDTGLISRSISFENLSGASGEGGKAASQLGAGRKGAPSRSIKPGEEVQLCDIEGPGTIRHIWLTTDREPLAQRAMLIRVWWDDQEHPSIECPVGDFFGFAHGKIMPYQSAVHSVGDNGRAEHLAAHALCQTRQNYLHQ